MDVTQSNFKEKLPVILEAISSASFLSIDGEFSGLNQTWNLNTYDTPAERYKKCKQNAEDFLLIQFGLCTFHFDPENDKYTHQAFNFYIFPRPYGKLVPDNRFYCQASSLEFLSSQGFDFNKLIKEGIPFVKASEEDSIRESLARKQMQRLEEKQSNNDKSMTNGFVPEEHKDFIDSVHSQVQKFLSSEEKSLQLSPCSAFRRKLIYETVQPKFPNLDLETVKSEKGPPSVRLNKSDKGEMERKNQERIDTENEQLESAIGFTKVVHMITESGKLVVGHNMFLDILHILSQFCCTLPEYYEEFKEVCKSVLPQVLDTKLMASTNPFKEHFEQTSLQHILKRAEDKPFSRVTVEPVDKCQGYSSGTDKAHEAGYDAYITGLCFISLARYLSSLQKKQKRKCKDYGASPLVQPFVNKIFMMMSPDIPYLNLAGDDLKPNRDHVFYVTFPKEWKGQDLYNLFSPYGPISFSWIDDCSAFVALKNADKSKNAKSLVKVRNDVHRVVTYMEHYQKKQQPQSRSVPLSDGPLPSKRKNSTSRNSTDSVSGSDHSIGPIPEEEEEVEREEKESPKHKKSKVESKLFDEPVVWN